MPFSVTDDPAQIVLDGVAEVPTVGNAVTLMVIVEVELHPAVVPVTV